MNVPKMRFREFKNEWKKEKFSQFSYNSGKRNKDNLNLIPYAITNTFGFVPQNEAHNEFGYMKDTDRKAYNIVTKNSFAYNPARINVGSIGYYSDNEDIIVSSLYEVFKTKNYINDKFIWYWLKSDKFPKWINRLQEGSVRQYFYYDKLCETPVYLPSRNEQEKISNTLELLDKKIELQSKKIEDLKLFKKGLISKLLNGYDYENMKIKDVLDFEQPTKYIVDSDEYINDDKAIPVLTANKAFILGYCNENNYYDKGDSIIFDDFTMDMKYTNFNYKVKSSAIKILTAKENHDLKFLYELLLSLNLTSEEHKRHYISTVQEMNVKIPSIEIQKNISSKLNLIDNKIVLEEEFFNSLIKLKKGLMQNMFV